ncbi:hypothetical protein R3P38DRAFT_28465 [Favolaschia claudopus]|uniref:Uncharacterized protein n=1 Tax=Favolaschia claudopus TaxID=2862362 RepID=A0AAW0EII9_9AGAR
MKHSMSLITLLFLFLCTVRALTPTSVPDPLICEDSIDGKPPFQEIAAPCLLGCDCVFVKPTGGFLPGQVNTTCIPYCNLDCVHTDATPSQSALAPSCWDRCQVQRATPENTGWCMYWCVEGYTDLVTSATCIPSLTFGLPETTVFGGLTETFRPFSVAAEWQSWYLTQTVIPRTANAGGQPTALPSVAPSRSSHDQLSSLPSSHLPLSTSASDTTSASSTLSSAPASGATQNGGSRGFLVPGLWVILASFAVSVYLGCF